MTNGVQYLPTYRSGFTGKSEDIGGSSPYHIDLKILSSLPEAEKIRALDSLAQQYAKNARVIEFSNQAVSGRTWDPNATPEQKKALFQAAVGAHAARPGWDPLDFYIPFKGKSRFDEGAVEGASIYIPGVPGGKITRGSGGGYGYFSEAVDPSGRVVFRVGHGDINRPEQETEIAVTEQQAAPAAGGTTGKSAEELLIEKLEQLIKPQQATASSYTGPSEEYFQKKSENLNNMMMKMLMEESARKREQPQTPQISTSSAAAAAAALAQRGFGTPKSLI